MFRDKLVYKMRKIMNLIMLTCEKAAGLIDKKKLFGLSRKEKIMLKMHTAVCKYCSAYQKQSELIEEALQKHFHNINKKTTLLPENKELKEKIISNLKNN